MIERQKVTGEFNKAAVLPYELRLPDFEIAMQDVYDFFHDVNRLLLDKGLHRMDDMLRPAAMSGMVSDMLTGRWPSTRAFLLTINTSTAIRI